MSKYPRVIERKDDGESFIHIGKGMYKNLWGLKNNSITKIPLEAFDKSLFTFYFREKI